MIYIFKRFQIYLFFLIYSMERFSNITTILQLWCNITGVFHATYNTEYSKKVVSFLERLRSLKVVGDVSNGKEGRGLIIVRILRICPWLHEKP